MRLERLRWWHLDEVVAMEPSLFAADAWSLEVWLSEVTQPANAYCVGLDGTEVVGVAGLAAGPFGEAYVQTVGVRGDRQGRGHGRSLLCALVAEADRRGAETMGLEVRDDNEPALGLYARAGFGVIGRRRGYYDHGRRDALVLQCPDLPGAVAALGGAPEVAW